MSNNTDSNKENNYQKLFGDLDFREGDKARSVYSPAAYLTDLVQLKDDEITGGTIDERRSDIVDKVVLGETDTFDEIPYLDIVNEQLEAKVADQNQSATKEEIANAAYEKILSTKYPVNLPFDLNSEKVKLYLNYLNITDEEFYKKLAPPNTNQYDYDRVASDYLGLSDFELVTLGDSLSGLFEDNAQLPKNKILIKDNPTGKDYILLDNMLSGLKISYEQLTEILTQNLSEREIKNNLQTDFFINQDANSPDNLSILLSKGVDGAVDSQSNSLAEDVESIVRGGYENEIAKDIVSIELNDLHRIYRFVYLAKKLNMSFSDLDLVIRTCCDNELKNNTNVIRILAVVKKLQKYYDLTVEEVCSLCTSMNTLGFGDHDDFPKDLFNKTFNGEFVHIDKQYISHENWGVILPEQYTSIEERNYTAVPSFENDILDNTPINADFKDRLYRTLGLSAKQFDEIIRGYRSKENEKFDNADDYDQLWSTGGSNTNHENLLNTLYRTKKLMEVFGLSHSELFTLLDVIEHDALIRSAVHRDIFIDLNVDANFNLQAYSPYDILRGATANHAIPTYRLWLFQVMGSVVEWLNDNELSVADLLMITTGDSPRDLVAESGDEEERKQEQRQKTSAQEKVGQLNLLYSRVKPTLLTESSFVGGPFNKRLSRIIHQSVTSHQHALVSSEDARLVRFNKDEARMAARHSLGLLDLIYHEDFLSLGIEDVVAQKVFQNLVLMGYLSTDGMMDIAQFPLNSTEFALETNFSPIHDQLFDKIMDVNENYVDAAIFPSDLEFLDLTTRETEELYDNLIFNNYLDSDGTIKQRATFESSDHKALFEVNSRIGIYAEDIYQHIHDRLEQFEKHTITMTPDSFGELGLSEIERSDIFENLKWNKYLTDAGNVTNKQNILSLSKDTFLLTVKFYPHQQQILDILQNAIKKVHTEYAKFDKDHFEEVSTRLVADWTHAIINEQFLQDSKLTEESKLYFSDAENLTDFDVTWPFTEEHNRIIFQHIKEMLDTQNKYQFSSKLLDTLDFSDIERDELVFSLQNSGYITGDLHLEWNMVDHFINSENAVLFTIKSFEDYSKDIFFILHELAKRLNAAEIAIVEALDSIYQQQDKQLYTALKDIMGLKESSLEALTHWLFGAAENAKEQWLLPILTAVDSSDQVVRLPNDIRFNIGYERFKRFGKLSSKLKLDEHEINLVFHDQDLVDKFSEVINLPVEIDSIDALLESSDGFVYVFKDSKFWVYDSKMGEQVEMESNNLSTFLTGDTESTLILSKVQSAFVDSLGRDVIVVDDTYYYREPADKMSLYDAMAAKGSDAYASTEQAVMAAKFNTDTGKYHQIPCMNSNAWQTKERQWGNTHDEGEAFHRVDAAFNDMTGATYLLSDNRIARYTNISTIKVGDTHPKIDATYPKNYDETDLDESLFANLPQEFKSNVDAAVANGKGGTYFFKGNHYVNSQAPEVLHSIVSHWGKEEIELATLEKAESAFAFNGQWYLFSGDYVFGYRDCIENEGLEILEGFPKKITNFFGDSLPNNFHRNIDAAFVIADYQQKDNTRLYLFHEDKFLVGSFIEANNAWVFGTSQDVSLWGNVQNLLATNGVNATLSGLDGRTYIFSGTHYYRYSGKDYYEADAGYPRSISDDWAGLESIDAAFTWNSATYLFGKVGAEFNYVRYSTNDYSEADDDYPKLQKENKEHLWNLPVTMAVDTLKGVDAVFNSPDGKTYLFLGQDFVYFDQTNNWWSEPKAFSEHWESIGEVDSVQAAFTGKNKKTYFFVKNTDNEMQYYRFSDADYCKPDVGYPRPVGSFWGNIKNHIVDCDSIDAAVSLTSRELKEKENDDDFFELVETNHVYIFSRDQYYRYKNSEISSDLNTSNIQIEAGYPKSISQLKFEPRFKALKHSTAFMTEMADGLDAVMSDERNVYLFKGTKVQVLSDNCGANTHNFGHSIKALTQLDGALFGIDNMSSKWHHISSLEGSGGALVGDNVEVPLWLSNLPVIDNNDYSDASNIDAVLQGTDHNTYVFSGDKFLNKQLNRENTIAEHWGKVRNNIQDNNHLDAAFTGIDNKLYMFSGDQYYVYEWNKASAEYEIYTEDGNEDDTGVHSIADKWHGLTNVNIAYRLGDKTYLCEKPDASGKFRYLCYKGAEYSKPTFSQPKYAGAELWGMPNHLLDKGWNEFDSILVENSDTLSQQTLLFVKDSEFIQYNVAGNHWFEPKQVDELWSDLRCHHDILTTLETLFVDPTGTVYFFGEQCVIKYGLEATSGETKVYGEEQIHNAWGKLISKLTFDQGVDATYVSDAGQTYLFSGKYYIRYSRANYCHIDAGYPKLVVEHLRSEPGFENLPKDFEVQAKAFLVGSGGIQGIVNNDRNRYLIMNNLCYLSSGISHTQLSLNKVIHRRNNLITNDVVDAALYIDNARDTLAATYLFSGDQYFRYTGQGCMTLDVGYPKRIATSLAADLITDTGETALTLDPWFYQGIDAAVYNKSASGNTLHLFKDSQYQQLVSGALAAISEDWGIRENSFKDPLDKSIDAAFVDEDGGLVVIKDGQLVRYSDTEQEYIESGYPKAITDLFHQLPVNYQGKDNSGTIDGLTGAFTYSGRLYLLKEADTNFSNKTSYVRYQGIINKLGHFGCLSAPGDPSTYYPTTFESHWSDTGDIRLYDLQRMFRYKELQRTYSGEHTLLDVIRQSGGYAKDPYRMLADMFGWHIDDIKWLKRNNKLMSTFNDDERHFKLEEIERLFNILQLRERLDAKVEDLFSSWELLYDAGNLNTGLAAVQLLKWLETRHAGSDDGQVLDDEIHDKLNLLKRDALLEYTIHYTENNRGDDYEDARDVYEDLLIDVKMGETAETSRVKEAISALQLYFHRFFINLEDGDLKNTTDPEAEREGLKERWQWMKNYRVWEANRKVFLYPENYIRPELRDSKTPEFESLEQNLLQGELNEDNIEHAYQNYIDSYSEISRLTITGGYVYPDPEAPDTNNKSVVLLGRTKNEPNTYYYRFANFLAKKTILEGQSSPVSDAISVENIDWKPWEKVSIQIDADRVYPVYALNKVFVFWASIETRTTNAGKAKLNIKQDNDSGDVTAASNEHTESVLKIYYSFYNLNSQWSAPQKLNYEITSNDTITNYFLEFTGNTTNDELKMDNIQVRCHFSSERELAPEENADGEINATQLLNLVDNNETVYLKSITESDEYFLKSNENSAEPVHVYAKRIIPGDGLPDEAGFKLKKSNIDDDNFISFQSILDNNAHLRHQGTIGKVMSNDGDQNLYNTDSSFSIHKGLVGSGYTIRAINSGFDSHVLFYGDDRSVKIEPWENLETFSEQRNASFKFIANRQSKQNSFQFFPDSNVVTELREGSINIGQSVYQSGFETFDSIFPTEDSNYVSLPVLLNIPESNGNGAYPWVCFDYKGGSFLCKPGVDDSLAVGSDSIIDIATTDVTNVDAAFHQGGKTYLFGNKKLGVVSSSNKDNPFGGNTTSDFSEGDLSEKWWNDGSPPVFTSAIDAAYESKGYVFLLRGNKYIKFASSKFDTSTVSTSSQEYFLEKNSDGLPKIWSSIDTAFSWKENTYFFKGAEYVTSTEPTKAKPLTDIFAGGISNSFASNISGAINGVFNLGQQLYISVLVSGGEYKIYPVSENQEAIVFNQLLALYSNKALADYNSVNNDCKRAFVVNGILFYETNSGEHCRIDSNLLVQYLSANATSVSAAIVIGSEVMLITNNQSGEYIDQQNAGVNVGMVDISTPTSSPINIFRHGQEVYLICGNSVIEKAYNQMPNLSATGPQGTIAWDSPKNHSFIENKVENGLITASDSAYVIGSKLYLVIGQIIYGYTVDSYNMFVIDSIDDTPTGVSLINAACYFAGRTYLFNGDNYYIYDGNSLSTAIEIKDRWGPTPEFNNLAVTKKADSAFIKANNLYLTSGDQYYKYNLARIDSNGVNASDPFLLTGYPKKLSGNTDGLAEQSNLVAGFYVKAFTDAASKTYPAKNYYVYSHGVYQQRTSDTDKFVSGNIQDELVLPEAVKGFNAALNIDDKLFLIIDNQYIEYSEALVALNAHENQKYDIVRLSSMTGSQLNKRLFVGGIDELMQRDVQELNELPKFVLGDRPAVSQVSLGVVTSQSDTEIFVNAESINGDLFPVDTHLEFRGANGQYYWEMFYHAPSLIANSLNTQQKFEEAKTWYEYIFDPTDKQDYWRFLPFLAVDVGALVAELNDFSEQLSSDSATGSLESIAKLDALSLILSPFAEALRGEASLSDTELLTLNNLHKWEPSTSKFTTWSQITELEIALETDSGVFEIEGLTFEYESTLELIGVIKRLPVRYNLMIANSEEQIKAYLDDPFDPHAIANLRRIAYRRTTVMAYIDNLLDWGDTLFRQYSHETINEARMLYVLAYDLLGKKPQYLGEISLSEDASYSAIRDLGAEADSSAYDFLFDSPSGNSADVTSFTHAGIVHESVGNPYFYVPENTELLKYWERIEDRLHKIRNSLNIMGIKQPLPLFQPPIDPMALVNAVASGAGIGAAVAGLNMPVPHYRFNFMLNKARELTGKVSQFGNDLLGNLEKKEAEELSQLQNKQESVILDLSRGIKEAQLHESKENLNNLEESKKSAEQQRDHYEALKKEGKISEEDSQINLMKTAEIMHYIVPALQIGAAIANAIPDVAIGPPFASSATTGGSTIGAALGFGAEALGSISEGFSMRGEIAGIEAQFKRMTEDWDLQLLMAKSEIIQLDYQIEGAKWSINSAEQEIVVHDKEVEHNKSIITFMKDKFSNEQLYQWMTSKLSKLYFQTYQMAHDLAKGAEKSYVFEKGLPISEVNFISGTYWDSLYKGLMSGDELGLDLDKMEKSYIDNNARGFEITKTISLADLDPIAFIKLKDKKECEFGFTEELFDYDFPGHYNRQIKTVAIKFVAGEGKVVNATLTQLSNKTVMKPDIKAVKYLMNPKDEQPLSVRSDWRPTQQIAASQPDPYSENSSGLFEVNFGDDRYLPFEGTGAISRWRLELGGKKGSYELGEISDVQVEVQYTAMQGGKAFGDAVKGMLKPYDSAVYIDLATTFPNEFFAWVNGETEDMEIVMTQDRFPNIAGSKLTAVYPLFEVKDDGQVSIMINDDSSLTLRSGKMLLSNALTVSKRGDVWRLSAKGNKADLVNAALVFAYKASVV